MYLFRGGRISVGTRASFLLWAHRCLMILLSELGGDAANLALRSLASLARRKVTAAKLAFRGKPIQTSRALACCHDITTILCDTHHTPDQTQMYRAIKRFTKVPLIQRPCFRLRLCRDGRTTCLPTACSTTRRTTNKTKTLM